MAIKRHRTARPQRKKSPFARQSISSDTLRSVENILLAHLAAATEPTRYHHLQTLVQHKNIPPQELKALVDGMLRSHLLRLQAKKIYALHEDAPIYAGEFTQNPKGFGFVKISQRMGQPATLDSDIFIPASCLHSALHGDVVLVRVYPGKANRMDGIILRVLARKARNIIGYFSRDKRGDRVIPEDPRFPIAIRVDSSNFPDVRNNQLVLVAMQPADLQTSQHVGNILEILGDPESVDVQMRLVIEKFQLPHQFSATAESESEAQGDISESLAGREDLRTITHVTIDGETAKDFDDAIAVIRLGSGYRLYVSIADVSYYVREGTALDNEAFERGTSVYFPGRVIPMLPERLSNDLCSLRPNQDRLTLTAILDCNAEGEIVDSRFCRSVIHSRYRLTYTEVACLLDGNTSSITDPAIIEMLNLSAELAHFFVRRRDQRGSLGFTLPEPEILLDQNDQVLSLGRAKRNFAHQIIEEFMLAANEAVAGLFAQRHLPFVYRNHELPNPDKVADFFAFATNLEMNLPPVESSPHWFSQILKLFRGTPKEYVINNLLLRTMQQARYSPVNAGHFGLAAQTYTHFTSPIRRYPDLMVHRLLCELITKPKSQGSVELAPDHLVHKCDFLSTRERVAINAEREMTSRLCLLYMLHHVNETFSAIISGVTASTLYIELIEVYASGSIPVESLPGDYYFYDETNHRLSGEIYRKIYQIGDLVTVTLTQVDLQAQRIHFQLREEPPH